jgi:DNA-binding MarR family transcriptional regulator
LPFADAPSIRTQIARHKRRASSWRRSLDLLAAWRLANAPTEAERREIEAEHGLEVKRGPDFLKVHRNSDNEAPVGCRDRNALAKLMAFFNRLERESYAADKAWADHENRRLRRSLPLTTGRVLLALVALAQRHQHVHPSLERLARMAQLCRRTVSDALDRLEALGLVRRYRRRKVIRTSFGLRVVQDTSAYEVIVPADLEAQRPAPPENRPKSMVPVQSAKNAKQLILAHADQRSGWIGPVPARPIKGDWRERERLAMALQGR